ncbi:hypothetical protein, partial [Paenibacillus sacheonensis]|uniref:hypothetical protein n=1 Tax=Paenibacillus sacheonensis TaxID=742054 RepID=UPI00195E0703
RGGLGRKAVPRTSGEQLFSCALAVLRTKGRLGFAMGAPVVLRTKVAPMRKTCAVGKSTTIANMEAGRIMFFHPNWPQQAA